MKKRFLGIFLFLLVAVLYAQNDSTTNIFPFEGRWIVSGTDNRNTFWSAYLIINEINGNSFSGYFDWYKGIEYAGREYYRGEYDSEKKVVTLSGYRLDNQYIQLALGIYRAYMARNGYDLEAGAWGGAGGIPGTWEAKWQE